MPGDIPHPREHDSASGVWLHPFQEEETPAIFMPQNLGNLLKTQQFLPYAAKMAQNLGSLRNAMFLQLPKVLRVPRARPHDQNKAPCAFPQSQSGAGLAGVRRAALVPGGDALPHTLVSKLGSSGRRFKEAGRLTRSAGPLRRNSSSRILCVAKLRTGPGHCCPTGRLSTLKRAGASNLRQLQLVRFSGWGGGLLRQCRT